MATRTLSRKMPLRFRPTVLQQLPINQVVTHHGISLSQKIQPAHRDEINCPWASANEPDKTKGGTR
jgi:hypothetical protein